MRASGLGGYGLQTLNSSCGREGLGAWHRVVYVDRPEPLN